jgi:anti-sigma B factor antagonist
MYRQQGEVLMDPVHPLDIEISVEGSSALVAVRGEIDLATQAEFRAALSDLVVSGQTDLSIDLSGVEFIDSTGLGALIGARRRVHAFNGSLRLLSPSAQVRKVFEVTGLNKVFDIVDPDEDTETSAAS